LVVALLVGAGCSGEDPTLLEAMADYGCCSGGDACTMPVCRGSNLEYLFYLKGLDCLVGRAAVDAFLESRVSPTPDEEQACRDAMAAVPCDETAPGASMPEACIALYERPGDCSSSDP
jgi:hypothetical protein